MPAPLPPARGAFLPASRLGSWLRRKGRAALLPVLLLGVGLLLGARLFRPATDHPEATARAYLRYKEILTYVDRDYVDSVDAEGLTEYALAQLLGRLDPHSVYIPARDRALTDAFLQSSYEGVGLEFNLFRDTATVVLTLPGSPAETAGLLPGDQLLRLDDTPLAGPGAGLDARQLGQRLRGSHGSSLRLLVARPHQPEPLRMLLTRAALPNPSVEPAALLDGAGGQVGYVRVNRFATSTYDEFKTQLAAVRRLGATRLVLDLRGNPGGYLDRATRLADEFIAGSRKLVYTQGRDEQYASQTYAHAAGDWEQNPLVVLVDENSASAAEVLAGALQDHDRALLVGRRTFGKGLVQQPIMLQDGGELRLTVARYYTPVGRCIQKSYGPDKATYNRELATRDAHGELSAADSVRPGRGPRFRTDHGRVVYGGGGILPDVLVARDTLLRTAYHARLERLGVIQAYALTLYRAHRAALAALPAAQYAAAFPFPDPELTGLARLATQAGLRPDPAALRRAAPALRACLRADIARCAYGPDVARALLRASDPELRAALRVAQDSAAQLALLGQ